MDRSQMIYHRIRWITRTGILTALLVVLQWVTAGTQAFAGQYITGSCVNCVLAVAVLVGGLWSGVAVALISPFCAFLLGIGPALIQLVPCIALGNATLVICLYFIIGRRPVPVWWQVIGAGVSAAAKFAVLYFAVIKVAIPAMGSVLKAPQIQKFTVMFSWPQLITALIGCGTAILILPLVKKAIKS